MALKSGEIFGYLGAPEKSTCPKYILPATNLTTVLLGRFFQPHPPLNNVEVLGQGDRGKHQDDKNQDNTFNIVWREGGRKEKL